MDVIYKHFKAACISIFLALLQPIERWITHKFWLELTNFRDRTPYPPNEKKWKKHRRKNNKIARDQKPKLITRMKQGADKELPRIQKVDQSSVKTKLDKLTPREYGRRCRLAFGELFKLQWGEYKFKDRKIIFKGNTLYSLYSDFNERNTQWFYGVPKSVWEDWQGNFLVFLMKEADQVNYAMLDSSESLTLLNKCGEDFRTHEKKIHLRRPRNGGKTYIVEWEEFPLSNRIKLLEVSLSG